MTFVAPPLPAAILVLLLAQPAAGTLPEARQLLEIEVSELEGGRGALLRLRADGPIPSAVVFTLQAPDRLVIDLPRVISRMDRERLEVGIAHVARVRVGRHPGRVRVVVDGGSAPRPFQSRRAMPVSDGLLIAIGAGDPFAVTAPEAVAPAAEPRSSLTPRRVEANPSSADHPVAGARVPVAAADPATPDPTQRPTGAPVAVYGLELDANADRDRILVFARGPLEYRVEEPDPETLVLVLEGAELDPTAPTRIAPQVAGPVGLITAFETRDGPVPEVRIVMHRATGREAEISTHGSLLAVDFFRSRDPARRTIALHFENTEIAEVVSAVANATGEAFLFDDQLRGRITVSVAERLSVPEALEVLDAALLLKGFAALPTPGGVRKIVPIDAAAAGAPWSLEEPDDRHEAPVATLLRLRAATPQDVLRVLQPLLGSGGLAIAHAPTNSLVLAGSERRLHRLFELVRSLDTATQESVSVRRLDHADAIDAAEIVRDAFEGRSAGNPFEAWADERSNSLILRAEPELLAELRTFVGRLDAPAPERGVLRVVRVRNTDAASLAEVLQSLAGGTGTGTDAGDARAALYARKFSVVLDNATNSLVLRGDPQTLRILEDVIDELDRAPPRVSVEILVLELVSTGALDLGLDFFLPVTNPKSPDDLIATVLSNPSGGGLRGTPGADTHFFGRFARAPLVIPIIDGNGNPISVIVPRETGVVTAQRGSVQSKVLMRPHLLTVSGEEHELFVGSNVPIATSQAGAGGAAVLETRQSIERQDVGLRLRVRPTVGEAGGVRLELDLETTDVVASLAGDVREVGPTIRQRRLASTIHLEDGEFAVVGMAVDAAYRRGETGTPWLKDAPILGSLFRASGDRVARRRLVVAVRARVLRSPEADVAESIRRRIGFERSLARVQQLSFRADTPYAVLVATRRTRAEADAVAQRVAPVGRPIQVTRWETRNGETLHDIYLTGFHSLSEAGDAARRLRNVFTPEVVALPGRAD